MWSSEEPIYALSSGIVPSGVAVIRLSGTGVFDVLSSLIARELPQPRMATLVKLKDPQNDVLLDLSLIHI